MHVSDTRVRSFSVETAEQSYFVIAAIHSCSTSSSSSATTTTMQAPSRTVHCCDALTWLQSNPNLQACSFITSMPDISELQGHQQLTLTEYKSFFIRAAQLVLNSCPDDGVAIFFQTDIKVDGTWLDKAYLIQRAAEDTGHALLWHKIICRAPPGTPTYGRPAYHHMLCFSKGVKLLPSAATADVLPSAGETTWTRGMGTAACAAACRFILAHTATRTVVDPFCGHGTVLAVANELGLDAVGVEIGAKRARQARGLSAAGLKLNKNHGTQQQQHGKRQQQQQEEQQEEEKASADVAQQQHGQGQAGVGQLQPSAALVATPTTTTTAAATAASSSPAEVAQQQLQLLE